MKLSIVVSVYNVEKYLRECLDSILCQEFSDFELIIVNDGSTDDSLAICNEYKTKDRRIRVIDKSNGGVSSARNAGIDVALGEYIAFVDSDDYIVPSMFNIMLSTILNASTPNFARRSAAAREKGVLIKISPKHSAYRFSSSSSSSRKAQRFIIS